MARIKAILFDLDGVLVDATEWHYEALNRALHLFGFDITRYEHLSAYNGLPTRKKLEMLSVEKKLPSALHALISHLKQIYTNDEIRARCHPVFEKEYMLSRLKSEGFRLAVCSNAIRDSVELMIRQSGLYDYFELVLSNEDVVRPKPDPEIYTKAIMRLSLKPEEVVIVEDAPHGIEAARRSGGNICQVAGFSEVEYFKLKSAIEKAEQKVGGKV